VSHCPRASVAGVFGMYATSGHLVYVTSGGTLMAAPFDERSLALTGRAAAVFDGVDVRDSGITDVTLSANGTLAYTTEGYNTPEEIVGVTRTGRPCISSAPASPSSSRSGWEKCGKRASRKRTRARGNRLDSQLAGSAHRATRTTRTG
jgi:hypothetical protein